MPQFFGPVCTPADNAPTYAFVEYVPNVAATYAYLVIFAVFLIIQLGLGLRYKTWFFCGGLACGLLLEIIGYVGRILLRSNPCSSSVFLMYVLVCSEWCPVHHDSQSTLGTSYLLVSARRS